MRILIAVLSVALSIPALAQQPSGPAQPGAAVVPVVLAKSIDSKKAKVGDAIAARIEADVLSGDKVILPRGAKIIGKVTAATSRSRGDGTSSLAFAFDRLQTKGGRTLAMTAVVQAIAAPEPPQPMAPPMGSNAGASAESGPAYGGANAGAPGMAGSPVGAVPETGTSAAGTMPTAAGAGAILTPQTTGVVGMSDVELNSDGDTAQLSSNEKSVKLESGTRILLRITRVANGSGTTQ